MTLTPNIGWGGQGSLGCGIGYGYLHRIPLRTTNSTPITKPNTLVVNNDKAPLLSAIPPPNTNGGTSMSFTLQPVNMPPITVTMPSLLVPPQINTNTTIASTNEMTATIATTTAATQPNTSADPSQFPKYESNEKLFACNSTYNPN